MISIAVFTDDSFSRYGWLRRRSVSDFTDRPSGLGLHSASRTFQLTLSVYFHQIVHHTIELPLNVHLLLAAQAEAAQAGGGEFVISG
jgi:hypothetical protein